MSVKPALCNQTTRKIFPSYLNNGVVSMSLPIGSFPFLTEKSVGSKRQQQYIALLNKKFKHCVVVHSTLGLVAKIFYSFPKKLHLIVKGSLIPFFLAVVNGRLYDCCSQFLIV